MFGVSGKIAWGSAIAAAAPVVETVSAVAFEDINVDGSVILNKPSGTVAGNILVAHLGRTGTAAPTPPAGWTLIDSEVSGTSIADRFYWKLAGGSEPASYTWTYATASEAVMGAILRISGANQSTPIAGNLNTSFGPGSGPTFTAPSITDPGGQTLRLRFCTLNSDAHTTTTNLYSEDDPTSTFEIGVHANFDAATEGTVGTYDFTFTGFSGRGITTTILIA